MAGVTAAWELSRPGWRDRVGSVTVYQRGRVLGGKGASTRDAQGRIFERFFKVDRARVRGEAGGTGLGLAIARHVIEQHHGRIWVESVEGVGSTFSFALPI